jgi:small-conductance mechanosensitive channel
LNLLFAAFGSGVAPPPGPLQQVITTTNATFSGTITLPAAQPTPLPVVNDRIYGFLHNAFGPVWPQSPFIGFLLTLVVWLGLALLAYVILFQALRSLAGRTGNQADNLVLRTIRVPVFVAVLAYGLVSALQELVLPRWHDTAIINLYAVTLTAAGFYLAWRIIKEVVLRWLRRRADETENRLDDLLVPLLNTVGPLILFLAAVVVILQMLGVDVGLVAVSIGAVGLILGLAFQDSLSNLFSGIYLMIDPPFRENDLIILEDGKICRVQRVGLRMSELYDMSNHALLYVPNKNLTETTISNITKPTVDLKVSTKVVTDDQADPETVRVLLQEILESHRNILGDPEVKLAVLRKRLAASSTRAGEGGGPLDHAIMMLTAWQAGREADRPIQTRLTEVRKAMNAHLTDAQAALRRLLLTHSGGGTEARQRLQRVLGTTATHDIDAAAMDEERMQLISRSLEELSRVVPASALAPLVQVLGAIGALDLQENQLEAELYRLEQEREDQLDRLLVGLRRASEQVAISLEAQQMPKDAVRVRQWARTMATQYAYYEVLASVEGLDHELQDLIAWLHELEGGGLSREERAKIRALFSHWGGVRLLEKRRVPELRRQVLRWLDWKEQGILPPSEYQNLIEAWERKLRLLSRRLLTTHTGDEEVLGLRLIAVREWIHSIHFLEPLADWKLPGATLAAFSKEGAQFDLGFYVDDIKMEHFSRQNRIINDVLMDTGEVFKREGIEIV